MLIVLSLLFDGLEVLTGGGLYRGDVSLKLVGISERDSLVVPGK
jgi:hypothetical protein